MAWRGVVLDVDQFVLAHTLVDNREPAGRDEAVGRRRGQPDLVRPSLGRQSPRDHCECALGLGLPRRLRQRQMDAEPVVTARVDERGHDADGALIGPDLQVGVHIDLVSADPRREEPSTWSGQSYVP